MENEPLFKNRFNNIYDHVLNYTIEERKRHNNSFFWLPHFENSILSRRIFTALYGVYCFLKVVFPVLFKLQHFRAKSFAFPGLHVRFDRVRESTDFTY